MEIIVECSDSMRGATNIYGIPIKEVVRCRDCKWYVPYTMKNKTYKMCEKAHLGSDDFFCADGERRDNE